jgi:hypothetical protein
MTAFKYLDESTVRVNVAPEPRPDVDAWVTEAKDPRAVNRELFLTANSIFVSPVFGFSTEHPKLAADA